MAGEGVQRRLQHVYNVQVVLFKKIINSVTRERVANT